MFILSSDICIIFILFKLRAQRRYQLSFGFPFINAKLFIIYYKSLKEHKNYVNGLFCKIVETC